MYHFTVVAVALLECLVIATASANACVESCGSASSAGQITTCSRQQAVCPGLNRGQPVDNQTQVNVSVSTTLYAESIVLNASGVLRLTGNITWSTAGATSLSRVVGYKLTIVSESFNHTAYYCLGATGAPAAAFTACLGQGENVTINPGDTFNVALDTLVNYNNTSMVVKRNAKVLSVPLCGVKREYSDLPQCAYSLTVTAFDCCRRSIELSYSLPKGYPLGRRFVVRKDGRAVKTQNTFSSPERLVLPELQGTYRITLDSTRSFRARRVDALFEFPNCSSLFLSAEVQSCSERTYILSYNFPQTSKLLFALTPRNVFAFNNHPRYHLSWESVNSTESRNMQIPQGYRKNYNFHTIQLSGYNCTTNQSITQTTTIDFSKCCQGNVKPNVVLVTMGIIAYVTKWLVG